jgi:transposase
MRSTDPRRASILRRIRRLWRSRPRGGILVFFDVKPVPVKAYGGRQYTRAQRLVLPARQKTRGFFYLFLSYEFNTGRVHWAYYPSKGAGAVCAFMKRLRRWYPKRPVRVVLDRDGAHPCKAKQTRRLMRILGLAWTTLPKGSPDDNPVEGLFSDVQQRVLDASDDAEPRTTQHRISGHLQGRNRRGGRIRVHYLPDSANH